MRKVWPGGREIWLVGKEGTQIQNSASAGIEGVTNEAVFTKRVPLSEQSDHKAAQEHHGELKAGESRSSKE